MKADSGLPDALESSTEALLTLDPDSTALDPSRKIFVNRTLRFDQIRQIGFDMDYTLLPYSKRHIEELSFKLTVEKLITQKGYPEQLRDTPYDPSFVVRGLVVDKKLGNIFKMDAYRHVGRVFHGRRPLSKEQRRKLYRQTKIRLSSPRYHWIDTLFALPEAVLYADVIDLFELQLGRRRIDYRVLFEDIRAAIDECHRDDSLKTILKSDFDKYVQIDPDTPLALHKLRSSGKKVFLLTNSYWDYTSAAMSYLLDGRLAEYPNWQNYFDVICVGASKPGFFTEDRPFFEIDKKTGEVSRTPAEKFERQHVYQGGCITKMEELLGDRGEDILYVGDHIYGDIIRSKKDTLWRTALVLEELEDEIENRRRVHESAVELDEIEERRADLEHEIRQLKLRISAVEHALDERPDRDDISAAELLGARKRMRLSHDAARRALRGVITTRDELEARLDGSFNPHWGSAFKEGAENSRFGQQVESYACIYTSRASNFRFYSPHQYFRSPRHWMPHEKA